jgi:hypothetical protein
MTESEKRLYWFAIVLITVVGGGLLGFSGFGWGCSPIDFTLDDSFISFRYAKNWAEGLGPKWVADSNPVEGYTSFLWVALLAFATALGMTPLWASKLLGIFSLGATAGIISLLAYRRRQLEVGLISVAGIALSPAFLLLSFQGMETGLAGLLSLLLAVVFVESFRNLGGWHTTFFAVLCLLLPMTRPEAVVFAGVLAGFLLYESAGSEEFLEVVKRLSFYALIPGCAFFAWRWWYYGYPLPNSAYAKGAAVMGSRGGILNVVKFVGLIASPYLLVFLYSLRKTSRKELLAYKALLLASGFFLLIGVFSHPIQAFLWRYQMPLYPVIIGFFAMNVSLRKSGLAPVSQALMGILLAGLPLLTWERTRWQMVDRWPGDRRIVGQALGDVNGDPRLFTTEAGALPYYSDWRARDSLGLVSEQVAHHGLTEEYLSSFKPDVVAMAVQPGKPRVYGTRKVLLEYLREYGFELAATFRSTSKLDTVTFRQKRFNLYFVNPESDYYSEITGIFDKELETLTRITSRHRKRIMQRIGFTES